MNEIIITSQSELDALLTSKLEARIIIKGGSINNRIIVRENYSVVVLGSSYVEAWGNSYVEALGNSSVVARNNSSVLACDNSSVLAWDISSVETRDNSSVVAWNKSSVAARDNSSVDARDNSSVVARDKSSVVARDNSSVEAWGNAGVYLQSYVASVSLFMFSACWVLRKGKVSKKSKTATIITPKISVGNDAWLEGQAIKPKKNNVVVFKRVSSELKTQEGTDNETVWELGKTLGHPDWMPTDSECGEGKFHACSRPYFCDEFRTVKGDRYLAIQVNVKDLHAWPWAQYPQKIAFRQGKVLYECNKFGKKI
jgi:hypothetical protein